MNRIVSTFNQFEWSMSISLPLWKFTQHPSVGITIRRVSSSTSSSFIFRSESLGQASSIPSKQFPPHSIPRANNFSHQPFNLFSSKGQQPRTWLTEALNCSDKQPPLPIMLVSWSDLLFFPFPYFLAALHCLGSMVKMFFLKSSDLLLCFYLPLYALT